MIDKNIIKKVKDFKNKYYDEKIKDMVKKPKFPFIGDEVLNEALASLIAGKNLLLVGDKSTGKNILAENLAYYFNRPLFTVSFHVNIDAYSLLGSDSLKDGSVYFKKGPLYEIGRLGGFGVLDEINMAKNEAISVLHQILDYRREIFIPSYKSLKLHPATRFIATMNYDYEGTRDLNQALLSRFVVIKMPVIKKDDLKKLIKYKYKKMKDQYIDQFVEFFYDLKEKSDHGEIITTSPDLRSLFDSFDLILQNLSVYDSLKLSFVNKSFDDFERNIISDLIRSRFRDKIFLGDVFINGWF